MAFIITEQTITIIENNDMASCSLVDCPFAEELKAALRRGDEQTALAMINKDRAIVDWVNDNDTMVVKDREVLYRFDPEDKWRPLHNALVDRILLMREQGFNPEPMIRLLFNIDENPSEESKKDIYTFLESNRLPVTIDGCFLAYKKVRADYTDCHTGKIRNKPGDKPKMDRKKVDADRTRTCSSGLHVCSAGYLRSFHGARTMLIKVHPKDVVSVPIDYKNSKMRVCEYEVIKELGQEDIEKVAVYVS